MLAVRAPAGAMLIRTLSRRGGLLVVSKLCEYCREQIWSAAMIRCRPWLERAVELEVGELGLEPSRVIAGVK